MIRFEEILDKIEVYNPQSNQDLLRRAYVFSALEHKGQMRRSGEPYLVHPLNVAAILAASALHLVIDLLQTDALVPLWPFSAKRISLDIEPAIDPWLLVILASAILIPELLHLVSDEIGSRTKRPRGRNGAIAGFAFALIYFGLRASLHATAVATLDARTIAFSAKNSSFRKADVQTSIDFDTIADKPGDAGAVKLR